MVLHIILQVGARMLHKLNSLSMKCRSTTVVRNIDVGQFGKVNVQRTIFIRARYVFVAPDKDTSK